MVEQAQFVRCPVCSRSNAYHRDGRARRGRCMVCGTVFEFDTLRVITRGRLAGVDKPAPVPPARREPPTPLRRVTSEQLGRTAADLRQKLAELSRQAAQVEAEAQRLGLEVQDVGTSTARTLAFQTEFDRLEAEAQEKLRQAERRLEEVERAAAEREAQLDQREKRLAEWELDLTRKQATHRAEVERAQAQLESEREQIERARDVQAQARAAWNQLAMRRDRLRRYAALLRAEAAALRQPQARQAPAPSPRQAIPVIDQPILAVPLLALILAVASFTVARQIATPTYAGSMVIQFPSAQAPSDPDAFVAAQRQRLLSTPVLESAIRRIDRHGYRLFASEAAMRDDLEQRLDVASSERGSLELGYRHREPLTLTLVLESLGKSLIESVPAGDGDPPFVRRAAGYEPEPVSDPTLAITVGGFAASFIAATGLYFWQRRRRFRPAGA